MKELKLIDGKGNVIDVVSETVVGDPALMRDVLAKHGYMQDKNKSKLTFGQANCFAKTASDIYRNHLNKIVIEVEEIYIAPFIVNATFAIELFLKSIHIKYEVNSSVDISSIHNLKKLFFALPGKLQKKLQESLGSCLMAMGREYDEVDLSSQFRLLANAFIDWRYMHEKEYLKAGKVGDLIPIMNALYCSSMDINWYEKDNVKTKP